MRRSADPGQAVALTLLVFAIAALLFGSPLRRLWLWEGGSWYRPFAVWLVVIALGAWAVRRGSHDA